LYEIVADTLNRHRYGRETTSTKPGEALERLRRGFAESRAGEYRRRPTHAVGLFEHEYAEDLSDEEWQRMRDRVFACLTHFFDSKVRGIILETRIENWLPIDSLDSFDFEGTRVYVAPDFALKNDQGNALLIDWKSGRPGEESNRMQLVCYGLFARDKWGIDPQRAIGELHYLLTGDVEIVTLDDRALGEGVEHIRGSIRAMKALDPRRIAEIDRFSPPDRGVCARCGFRCVCWPKWPALEPGPA
jgi:CRISPR/Cas system-associated exonuclease Cas4 (RecB family)